MICTECGRHFTPEEWDQWADEQEVCADCQAEEMSGQAVADKGKAPQSDEEDDYPDVDDWDEEPCGSCDWCGSNVYTDDYDGLCEQCAWYEAQGEGSPDVGSGGAL